MKIKIILTVILLLTLLSGCWDYSDIEADIFVAGFAIDYGDSGNEKYLVSAEVITTEGSGSGESISTKVISSEGSTVLEALNTLVSESSKELFFDHCKILVLSKEVSCKDLIDILDLAFRDTNLRLSMKVVVAKDCKAYEILNSNSVINVIKSYEIAETIKINSKEVGFAPETEIYKLLNQLNDLTESGTTPAYTLVDDIADENMNILEGVALFKEKNLVGYLENKQSQLYMMAAGKFTEGAITCYIPAHDQLMTIHINECRRKVKTETSGNFCNVLLTLILEVSLPEIPSEVSVKDQQENVILQNDISNYIEDNVYATVKDTIKRYGTEIFGFSSKIQAQQTEFCRQNSHRWEEVLNCLKLDVECRIKIKSSGITNDRIYKENQ